jgi:DUF4097 and DUF4098 domain-containing protein YvlB
MLSLSRLEVTFMRLAVRSAAVIAPVLLLASCDDAWFGDFDRYKEDFHYSYPLSSGGRVSLENMNGSVDIVTWEKDAVEINGTKYASSQQALNDIKIDISTAPSSISIRTVQPFSTRNGGARYSLRLPRRVQLDRIVSSNGSIKVQDVEGMANLRSSNGGIRVWKLNGPLDARTSNGGIDATDVSGNASLHTSNGGIHVELNKGSLDAGTSNGGIEARLIQPDAGQPVRLESTNGHIDLSLDAVRDVRANTSNSSITVRLPDSASVRVRARTSNSSITSEFDALTRSMSSKNSLDGTLGSGGPLIDLWTSNGSIKLLRR